MKLLEAYFSNQKKSDSYTDRTIFEGDIDRHSVMNLADGGLQISITTGDEFGNELTHKIQLDRFDVMLIQDLIAGK